MGKNQFSYWFCRAYFSDNDEMYKMMHVLPIRHFAFIKHDKDYYTVSSENYIAGDLKKPHYHFLINLRQAAGYRVVHNMICSFHPDCGLWLDDVHDPEEAQLYMLHLTTKSQCDEGKHEYDYSELCSDDKQFFLSKIAKQEVAKEHCDLLQEFYKECVFDYHCIPMSLVNSYVERGGRDFILKSQLTFKLIAMALHSDSYFSLIDYDC